MEKNIKRVKEYVILGTVFLFPLFVSNVFIDQIQLPKLVMLIIGICLSLIVIAIEIFVNKKFIIGRSKFDFPVLLIMFAYLVSGILATPNKVEAFFSPGSALLIVGLGILYFLINSIESKEKVKIVILADGFFISVATLMSFLGLFEKLTFLPTFIKAVTFNPTGDYLTSTVFLVSALIFGINFLIKEKIVGKKLLYAFSTAMVVVGAGISIFTLFDSNKNLFPILPPLHTSWTIAIDSIKESPVLGMGPGNYLTAFDRFRPIDYNLTKYWQLRFSSGRNLYLTILTETGLMGAIGISILIITIIKIVNKSRLIYKQSHTRTIDMLSMLLLIGFLVFLAFFPASPTSLFLLFVLISINSRPISQIVMPGKITSLLIAVAVIFLVVKSQPIVLAEFRFKQAYDALALNDGKKTYDLLRESINLNPYVDRYHASFAQVNLALARSIASSKKDPKDLGDDEKNTITTLIQQAIREGQATVTLNPTRSANWEILSNVYQVIIPFAAEADNFAIQSYNQTINLNPINPNLRISLGQIYYSLGRYDEAINTFQLAILAKDDLANSHYNLSLVYRDKSQIDKAIEQMKLVLTLVENPSPDYTLAKSELDALEKKKAATTPNAQTGSTTLTTPEKTKPAIDPQITLPTDASPPAAALPSPTP